MRYTVTTSEFSTPEKYHAFVSPMAPGKLGHVLSKLMSYDDAERIVMRHNKMRTTFSLYANNVRHTVSITRLTQSSANRIMRYLGGN